MRGIPRSISATLGRRCRIWSSAWPPSRARPTTSTPRFSRYAVTASRTAGWSSATTHVIAASVSARSAMDHSLTGPLPRRILRDLGPDADRLREQLQRRVLLPLVLEQLRDP